MNKLFFSMLALLMMTSLNAQPEPGPEPGPGRQMMQERIESQRIAYITQKLELTPDESTKFWPIYNEYRAKEQELRKAARPEGGVRDLSDADAEKVIEQHFATEEKLLDLKREYYGKLKSAIPAHKIARLVPVEMEFNRMVLEHIRDRMGQRDKDK